MILHQSFFCMVSKAFKIRDMSSKVKFGKTKVIDSEEVKMEVSGAKILTKKTVRTLAPKGHEKATPWGVTLKPVPRRTVSEETTKIEKSKSSKAEETKNLTKLESSKTSKAKLNKPEKIKVNKSDTKLTQVSLLPYIALRHIPNFDHGFLFTRNPTMNQRKNRYVVKSSIA